MCRPLPARRAGRLSRLVLLPLALLALFTSPACSGKQVQPVTAKPRPTYTGPRFLHGTVGSMATLEGFEPLYVNGYGLVFDLKGTGSDAPGFLRPWLINEMRRRGFGSARYGRDIRMMTPERVLASNDAAPVLIEGLIPPGATQGTRFDVLVQALPGTQTTSLEGGRLYEFNLAIQGANTELRYSRPLARAKGPIYLDPFEEPGEAQRRLDLEREGVVLSGGTVTVRRSVRILLNQPSYTRARSLADRINERFPRNPDIDKDDIAVPKSPQVIQINVPARFSRRPERLLALISHVYIQRSATFETEKAQELGRIIEVEPRYTEDAILGWQTLGRTVLPVVRQYYGHEEMRVRLAALEAGSFLGDEKALGEETGEVNRGRLLDIARSENPDERRRAAQLLVNLPGHLRGAAALRRLLDDDDRSVRIAAYESLADAGDPMIQRTIMGDASDFKFVLDLVPAEKPLIYVTQSFLPRVVIFNPMMSFQTPTLARLWDNRLMLRQEARAAPIAVYYQPPGRVDGKTYEIPAPSVAAFVFLLAHRPTVDHPTPGLDLTYSRVVNALHTLCRDGYIVSDFEVQTNPLPEMIRELRSGGVAAARPDSALPQPIDSVLPVPEADEAEPTYEDLLDDDEEDWDLQETDSTGSAEEAPAARPPLMPVP